MDITIATEVAAVLAPALPYLLKGTGEATKAAVGGSVVELGAAVGRNKPAPAGVSGELTGRMPETVVARPYSGLQPSLCRQLLWPSGGS